MCVIALVFAVRPLYRERTTATRWSSRLAIVFVVAMSVGLYSLTGQPGIPSGPGEPAAAANGNLPDISEMVTTLAERLEREPDDVEGWKMLGRTYLTLGQPDNAVSAWERAVELTASRDADSLVGLGDALMAQNDRQMTPPAAALFESALALEPNNQAALFWGGIAAFTRGEPSLAADRWEILLASGPPPELRPVIEERIAAWRGQPVPAVQAPFAQAPAAQRPAQPASGPSGRIVAASLSVGDEAAAALPADATVFVIARDPAAPSPPIAVTRRRLADLPIVVELGNGDSMMPGRELGNFPEFELVARVSLSGGPGAQSGDWFGALIVRPADGDEVDLTIDTRVE
jgi:cytochrome c-type biogenesis protein CcmH